MKIVLLSLWLTFAATCYATETPSTKATVLFLEPKAGAVVAKTFKVKMGLTNMQIGKVGDLTPGKGHHHLLINQGPLPKGAVVPTDSNHLHFGKGQTEAELTLAPGKHKLTLQFADGAHRSYGEELSATIEVEVK